MKNLGVFDKTCQVTMRWIEAVSHEMGSPDPERGYHVLRAALHAIRDRATPEEAVQLGAQLPMLIRGFYYEGWHPSDKPERYRHKREFLAHIGKDVPALDDVQRERAAVAAFRVLNDELGGPELDQVRQSMPAEIRDLWPSRQAS